MYMWGGTGGRGREGGGMHCRCKCTVSFRVGEEIGSGESGTVDSSILRALEQDKQKASTTPTSTLTRILPLKFSTRPCCVVATSIAHGGFLLPLRVFAFSGLLCGGD